MSKKRCATTELTRSNWDQEEEPEEIGTPKLLDPEKLANRIIKTAKRRLPPNAQNLEKEKSVFSNFAGFSKLVNSTPDVTNTFSFLKNVNGSPQASTSQLSESAKPSKESVFLTKLKHLNECLTEWISKCVSKNPTGILTPIFRDYEEHLKALQNERDALTNSQPESNSSFKFNFAQNYDSATNHSAGSLENKQLKSSTVNVNSSPGSFGLGKPDESTKGDAPSFTFNPNNSSNNLLKPGSTTPFAATSGAQSEETNANSRNTTFSSSNQAEKTTGLSVFSSPKPFFFQNVAPTEKKEDEDEEDEPPKNEFTPVTEKDALYTKRVKVFVQTVAKNDGEEGNGVKKYSDRGVGTLYVKEVEDAKGEKTKQAVVRADTSLGNVIFNIRLSSAIPLKRLGKNNVCLVCIPTPDSKPPPVPVLLRVKTGEEADELLDSLNKHKEK